VVWMRSSSWMAQRVDATDCAKQHVTSKHRQHSGLFCSPQRPLHGQVPLQQMYLCVQDGEGHTNRCVQRVHVAHALCWLCRLPRALGVGARGAPIVRCCALPSPAHVPVQALLAQLVGRAPPAQQRVAAEARPPHACLRERELPHPGVVLPRLHDLILAHLGRLHGPDAQR
jgi:hypothetical protein